MLVSSTTSGTLALVLLFNSNGGDRQVRVCLEKSTFQRKMIKKTPKNSPFKTFLTIFLIYFHLKSAVQVYYKESANLVARLS